MSSTTKTKTDVAPPSWAQGTITNALGAEQSGYDQAKAQLAQFQPQINAAITNTANLAAHPSAFQTDAQGQLDKTIRGDYLDPNSNPWAAGMGKLIADQTAGQYGATYGSAGRSHGGMAALMSSQGVGNALGSFYGGLYNNERGLQQQAIGMEPAMNADQYTGANQLLSQVDTSAMTPEQIAAMFGNSVAGTVGPYGTTTTTQKQPFGLQSILGLGLMGASAIPGVGSALGMGAGPMFGMGAGMAGGGMGGFSPYGMAGLIPRPSSSGSINIGGGTADFFAHNPFGGI